MRMHNPPHPGEFIKEVDSAAIYPAKYFVTTKEQVFPAFCAFVRAIVEHSFVTGTR